VLCDTSGINFFDQSKLDSDFPSNFLIAQEQADQAGRQQEANRKKAAQQADPWALAGQCHMQLPIQCQHVTRV
jgi:hypothetical protein